MKVIDARAGRNKIVFTSCHLFKDYVDLLFKMKEDGVEGAKEILNILWGALGELDKTNIYIDNNDKTPSEIYKRRTIKTITPLTKTRRKIEIVVNDKMYKSNFARVLPFLLAKARYKMSKTLEPHLQFVKRVHTDSMFTTQLLKDENGQLIQTGHELGELSYKGKCMNCHIYNSVQYTGKFSY